MRQHLTEFSMMSPVRRRPQSFRCGFQQRKSLTKKHSCMHSLMHRVTQLSFLKTQHVLFKRRVDRSNLSTMDSKTTVEASQKLSGLQVREFNSEKKITVPTAYTRKFIPANHIPTPETARAWPHLEHITHKSALP